MRIFRNSPKESIRIKARIEYAEHNANKILFLWENYLRQRQGVIFISLHATSCHSINASNFSDNTHTSTGFTMAHKREHIGFFFSRVISQFDTYLSYNENNPFKE